MIKLLRLALPSLIVSLIACGCHIETHRDSVEPGDTNDTCGSYCLHLYECSSIAETQIDSCLGLCDARLRADAEGTASGCECVLSDECRALSDYACPGAPIPSGGFGTGSAGVGAGGSQAMSSGGTTSSGGASSSGGAGSGAGTAAGGSAAGGATLGCQGGYQCGPSEDCVEGACRARCTASCQCPTDLSCIDHYCRSAAPPPACATDCECASGQHCISGSCG